MLSMIAENQTFTDKRIWVDGSSFHNCRFIRCVFVYSGLMGVAIVDPAEVTDCRWEFQGPAKETINFMTAFYQAGSRELIESIFDDIRGRPVEPN
jgi:hypothetical protein